MQNKIIYSDNGKDKAITGHVTKEDDFFIEVLSRGRNYRIGKRSVICVKQCEGSEKNG